MQIKILRDDFILYPTCVFLKIVKTCTSQETAPLNITESKIKMTLSSATPCQISMMELKLLIAFNHLLLLTYVD